MTPDEWYVEAVKQIPALGVLVFLVIKFITALREMAVDGKQALNDAHETTAKVVDQFTAERKESAERMDKMHDRTLNSIDRMQEVTTEVKTIVSNLSTGN